MKAKCVEKFACQKWYHKIIIKSLPPGSRDDGHPMIMRKHWLKSSLCVPARVGREEKCEIISIKNDKAFYAFALQIKLKFMVAGVDIRQPTRSDRFGENSCAKHENFPKEFSASDEREKYSLFRRKCFSYALTYRARSRPRSFLRDLFRKKTGKGKKRLWNKFLSKINVYMLKRLVFCIRNNGK